MAVSGPQEPNKANEPRRPPPSCEGVAEGSSKVSAVASKVFQGLVPEVSDNLSVLSPSKIILGLKEVLSLYSPKGKEVIDFINKANEEGKQADLKKSLPEKPSDFEHVIEGACQDFCREGHVNITIGNWNPFIRVIASDKTVKEQEDLHSLNRIVGKMIYTRIEELFKNLYGEGSIEPSNQARLNTWIAFTFVYQMGSGVILSMAQEKDLLSSVFKPILGNCPSMVIDETTNAQGEIEITWTQKFEEFTLDAEGAPTIPGQKKTVTAHITFPSVEQPTLSLAVQDEPSGLASSATSSALYQAWKRVFG